MTVNNLSTVLEQIQSEITVNDVGVGIVSIRGAARLAGVTHPSLIQCFSKGELQPSKLFEKLTTSGFEPGNLVKFSETGIPDTALSLILEYYAFDAGRYCTEQSRIVYRAFASVGIRVWLQQSVGWVAPETKRSEALIKADKIFLEFQDVKNLHPVSARTLVEMLMEQMNIKQKVQQLPVTSQDDLNSSLVANRLGLAFNKHMKAFELLRDATSPEAFTNLKEQYLQLATEHAELLKTRKPDYNDRVVYQDNPDTLERLNQIQKDFKALQDLYSSAKEIMKVQAQEIEMLKKPSVTFTSDDIFQEPPKEPKAKKISKGRTLPAKAKQVDEKLTNNEVLKIIFEPWLKP